MTYEPFDQERHLGPPPWTRDATLEAWEEAHGHDVRLKCYEEFGCMVLVPYEVRQGQHRLLSWLAQYGQGDIKGRLLEAAEQAIEDGTIDAHERRGNDQSQR